LVVVVVVPKYRYSCSGQGGKRPPNYLGKTTFRFLENVCVLPSIFKSLDEFIWWK
jgi:hypothetical protein